MRLMQKKSHLGEVLPSRLVRSLISVPPCILRALSRAGVTPPTENTVQFGTGAIVNRMRDKGGFAVSEGQRGQWKLGGHSEGSACEFLKEQRESWQIRNEGGTRVECRWRNAYASQLLQWHKLVRASSGELSSIS